jgi:hypothetical protein
MKYKVLDEDGIAIRTFATATEAFAFLQEGWTIKKLPRKPKIDLFALIGECLI